MTRLVLIRHGETEWNVLGRYQGQTDIPLSAAGRKQAQRLAENFPLNKLDAIYASDLSRAMTTAEAIGARFSLPVTAEPAFRELNFGAWEGKTYREINDAWPEEVKNFFGAPERLKIPQGETFRDAAARSVARLKAICQAHPDGVVAIVMHGAVLRATIATLLHIPLHYVWSLRTDNTSVNVLRLDGEYVTVEVLNSTAHLSAKLPDGAVKGQSPDAK